MESLAEEASTDALQCIADALNVPLTLEPPVMLYHANPYVTELLSGKRLLDEARGSQTAPEGAGKKHKNGCVEYYDAETHQRTRIAGNNTFSSLTPLDVLPDERSCQDGGGGANVEDMLALFADKKEAKKPVLTDLDAVALRNSTVLNRLAEAADADSTTEISEKPYLPPTRRRSGENMRPRSTATKAQNEELFMRHYQNFCVLDDVMNRTQRQLGYTGNVEKVRVEMQSLEDGYKWRKYGRKEVKGNTYPRNYFKCTFPNCMCRKRVEQNQENPCMLIVTYEGRHIHPPPFLSQQLQSQTSAQSAKR